MADTRSLDDDAAVALVESPLNEASWKNVHRGSRWGEDICIRERWFLLTCTAEYSEQAHERRDDCA